MERYPEQLPLARRQNYGINHVSPMARTGMVTGRARQRRTFTSVPSLVTTLWIFTPQEGTLFEAWFRYTLKDGTEWFEMPLRTPLNGGSYPRSSLYKCRFTGMYQGPEPIGPKWQYTAELEIWERPTLAPGWEQFPDYILHADIIDLAVNREWPEA